MESAQNNKEVIVPFLKWAGGKRWLVKKHPHLFPNNYNRYIEPFLGSGAVFFFLKPSQALLSDINHELVDAYRAIKQDYESVYNQLKIHHRKHSKEYYYKIRSSCPRKIAMRAARFIYLNRTCWNGLYRVNRKGEFNVPIGTKHTVLLDNDRFDMTSEMLNNAVLHNYDFEILIDQAIEGDLLFVDPPYTVRHNNNSFIKYNEKLFSWADQKRLFAALKRAKDRGVLIVSTNANCISIRNLYSEKFQTKVVSRHSVISSKLESRGRFEELVIYTE